MEQIKGLALLCNLNGLIHQVMRNDFDLDEAKLNNKLFTNIIDEGTRNKSLNFLLEIKTKKIAFDYQLNVFIDEVLKTLYFIGIQLQENVLIIGADNHKEAIEFTNNLQSLNNQQANIIRTLLKDKYSFKNEEEDESKQLFDEISNLNNELVNMQRELTKKNIELDRLNSLKNKFLGMAAHDLRNPLGIVLNYSDFILEEAEETLSDEHKMFLNIIHNHSNYMLNLINDLLDVSVIESGKLVLRKETTELISFIKGITKINQTLANNKKIKIVFNSDVESLEIDIDKDKINQVLDNLLTNAIKFSNENTIVEVNCSVKEDKAIVSVKDQGIGISKEDQAELFKLFSSAGKKGTKGEKSTGLGLVIVKQIIEGHKGRIWVESKTNSGSSFIFELPLNSFEK
jgi:signal transduction histidine kinase